MFKKVIIKVVFAETGFYLFNLKKVLNQLPPPPEAILEKDLWLTTIDITILKTLR